MAGNHNNTNYMNLYKSRAHVFQINPLTKNSWLAKGESAIPISFITLDEPKDNSVERRELKIIGTNDDGETVLDSVILLKTQFTKRSQKFGQWTDPTGMVYGLGFNTEDELNDFVEVFQKLQRNILNPQASSNAFQNHQTANATDQIDKGAWNRSQEQTSNGSEINGRDFRSSSKNAEDLSPGQYSNTLAHQAYQQMARKHPTSQVNEQDSNIANNVNETDISSRYIKTQSIVGLQAKSNNGLSGGRVTPETEGSTLSQSEWHWRDQLKQATYENERLKQALEESSKNAGVWHNELLNLRTNNVKLTQALQESKSHVEEWERELLSLRDENKELKLRVMALESANNSENNNDYKADLQRYKDYVDEIQSQLRKRDDEIENLQKSLEHMELNTKSSSRNGQFDDVGSTRDEMISSHQKQRFDVINAKLEAKVSELAIVQKEFSQLVEKLYQ